MNADKHEKSAALYLELMKLVSALKPGDMVSYKRCRSVLDSIAEVGYNQKHASIYILDVIEVLDDYHAKKCKLPVVIEVCDKLGTATTGRLNFR